MDLILWLIELYLLITIANCLLVEICHRVDPYPFGDGGVEVDDVIRWCWLPPINIITFIFALFCLPQLALWYIRGRK